jgi:hypothetical protein
MIEIGNSEQLSKAISCTHPYFDLLRFFMIMASIINRESLRI